jgi:very-short-patch-repair endonuclease
MSNLSDQVLAVINEVYPEMKVLKEEPINYKGHRLFIDFLIPQLNLIIEVHGRQHDGYVKHFHGDGSGFRAAKKRDALKHEWAELNGYIFVALREHELPVTVESLLEKINVAADNG